MNTSTSGCSLHVVKYPDLLNGASSGVKKIPESGGRALELWAKNS